MPPDEDARPADPVARFGRELANHLGIEPAGEVSAGDTLFDDWGLDSFQAFQLLIVIESMADVALPPPGLPSLLTVQDAYDYFRLLTADREA